jgi:hypothetical protein
MLKTTHTPTALRTWLAPVGIALILAGSTVAVATGQRFFSDDPLTREPESQDASGVQEWDVGLVYDLAWNLFVTPGRKPSNVHAQNVNTIDEVPDSGWFTNRILPRQLSTGDFVRGPNVGRPPNPERWVFTREKSAGYAPGFTARDADGETWFISFDAPGYPEGASAAMVVASKIFWALGYNQVETFITSVDRRNLRIDPKATIRRPNGKRTPATQDDLDAIFERAARNDDGTYRAAAGRLLPGRTLGPFRYEGTRPDDPNDTVDHQHRRELRALRVFGAWTNLTDLKAGNTLDTLVNVNGRWVVRHFLQDVGSTFGIGANGPHDWDEGFEYFYQGHSSRRRLMSLGFAFSSWQTTPYTLYPSVGRFESEAFDPPTWKPHAPTAAYIEMLPDDAFWAARRVAAFDDELIRDLVHAGRFSDPAAEAHLAAILIQRRDKVARAYLAAINPVVEPRLSAAGELAFDNAAVDAGVAKPPDAYRATWWQFDNVTGRGQSLGETRGANPALKPPRPLPSSAGAMVEVDVSSEGASNPAWQRPVRLYFRRTAEDWTLVGLEREVGANTGSELSRPADGRVW